MLKKQAELPSIVPKSNDNLEIFFLCVLIMRSIPLSIPNIVRPIYLNSDQPECPLSETNC